jgi:hypothetical protein
MMDQLGMISQRMCVRTVGTSQRTATASVLSQTLTFSHRFTVLHALGCLVCQRRQPPAFTMKDSSTTPASCSVATFCIVSMYASMCHSLLFSTGCVCVASGGSGIYFKVWEPLATLLPNVTGLKFPLTVHSNKLYGNLTVCAGPGGMGRSSWCHAMEDWLALGLDPGTTVISTQAPPSAHIVQLAHHMLGIHKQK